MFAILRKWWLHLIGASGDFSMENRMFNVVSIISFFLLLIISTANIIMAYYTVAWLTFLMAAIDLTVYYLARFANRFDIASYTFAFLTYPSMGANYFVNSGIDGPSVYGFLLTFLIIVIITPPKTHLLWIVMHITVVSLLFTLEIHHPEWVDHNYVSESERAIDLSLTYIPGIIFIYMTGVFVRFSYNREKTRSENRLIAIEDKNRQLESSNQEKDRLFSIIGHDLRSPLNTIQGYLEILSSMNLEESERNEIQHQLTGLTANTSNLLNNLLQWSRNDRVIEISTVDLHQAIMEVINLMQPLAYRKGVNLHWEPISGLLHVNGQKDMLQLVVRNLISNAIKFTPAGECIHIFCKDEPDVVNIHICDSGIGVPPEQQPHLFTNKISSTNGTEQESGIGLGLVLCKEFTEKMGGSIRYANRPDKGTEFIVSLNRSR